MTQLQWTDNLFCCTCFKANHLSLILHKLVATNISTWYIPDDSEQVQKVTREVTKGKWAQGINARTLESSPDISHVSPLEERELPRRIVQCQCKSCVPLQWPSPEERQPIRLPCYAHVGANLIRKSATTEKAWNAPSEVNEATKRAYSVRWCVSECTGPMKTTTNDEGTTASQTDCRNRNTPRHVQRKQWNLIKIHPHLLMLWHRQHVMHQLFHNFSCYSNTKA